MYNGNGLKQGDINEMNLDYRLNNTPVNTRRKFFADLLTAFLGCLIFAGAMNLIIVPLKFYSGGILGISQLVRSFLRDFLGFTTGGIDIAGIIYYLLNIPLMWLAYTKLGKTFFLRTLLMTTAFTVAISLIPILPVPPISDPLTASIVAGVLCGYGAGIILRAGYSAGGPDILGLYFTKYFKGFSVGKITLFMNIIVFTICAFLYNFEVVVYSFIFNIVISLTLDKVHFQNITVLVTIFSKKEGVPAIILNNLQRGVTSWKGQGGYTGEPTNVYCTIISKYEVEKLNSLIMAHDPQAFIISQEGTGVTGNFEKRL